MKSASSFAIITAALLAFAASLPVWAQGVDKETPLYSFNAYGKGGFDSLGTLAMDSSGNLYGAALRSNTTQVAELTASDAAADDLFGWSVAIEGNTVVVGASQNLGGGCLQGKVYVFVKPSSGWANMTETEELTASDGVLCGELGESVAVSQGTVAVGAPQETAGGCRWNSSSISSSCWAFEAARQARCIDGIASGGRWARAGFL